jgi:hypothetical protein
MLPPFYYSSFIFLQINVVWPVLESILVLTATQLQVTVLAFSCLVTTQCSIVSALGGGNWLRNGAVAGGGGGGAAACGFLDEHPAIASPNRRQPLSQDFFMPLFSLSTAFLSMAILITRS